MKEGGAKAPIQTLNPTGGGKDRQNGWGHGVRKLKEEEYIQLARTGPLDFSREIAMKKGGGGKKGHSRNSE